MEDLQQLEGRLSEVQPEQVSEVLEQLPQTPPPVEVEGWDQANRFELGKRDFCLQLVGRLSEVQPLQTRSPAEVEGWDLANPFGPGVVRPTCQSVRQSEEVHPPDDADELQQLLPSDYQLCLFELRQQYQPIDHLLPHQVNSGWRLFPPHL